ncbi:hypothetical protein L2E82_45323 [Cichorium intybus]|uniref:Uncharacterized protein n=2 Tax=Cichorium intybus TaxID=13427 RepID=A0ACB8ZSP4_CICIN|nr:hypothetical protein L2E82_45207 [Cichorium intybus]KAI3700686.1 hypothetical protein L2E82_45323 [Cichorium intybus]
MWIDYRLCPRVYLPSVGLRLAYTLYPDSSSLLINYSWRTPSSSSFKIGMKRVRETEALMIHVVSSIDTVAFLLWDFYFQKGSVIENIDGHTNIIHKQLDGEIVSRWVFFKNLLLMPHNSHA